MASIDLEQQLRNEMQNKFNVVRKSNAKKRKAPHHNYPNKKQKLSHPNTSTNTKQTSIDELKALGLVQGSKSSTNLLHQHRSLLPPRNNNWKQKKQHPKTRPQHQLHSHPKKKDSNYKQRKSHKLNTKIELNQLHEDVNIYSFKSHSWYDLRDVLSNEDMLSGHKIAKQELLSMDNSSIFMIAESLYQQLTTRDRIRNEFHSFALAKGTFRDKLSTMMFRVEQFSLTRLSHLDSIINILSQDTKRQAVSIIPSMIELFINSLLPQRHLSVFNDQWTDIKKDQNIQNISQMNLVLFYFEHSLKKKYKSFIELLEFYSANNEIEKLHYESTLGLYRLLMSKPENESFLLNLLINKFGENDKETTRRITEYLLKISAKHPMMKPEIIREIHNYLKRPSLSPRGLYRAVFFLSKLRFCSLENEAATLLCGIYMDLFKQLISYQSVFDVMNDNRHKQDNKHKIENMDVLNKLLHDHESNANEALIKSKQLNIMTKLMTMTRKRRNVYFKTHRKELAIWKRFVLLEEITPKLVSCILKGISYVFPLANLNLKVFKQDLDYIYKLILKSNMKIALMALQFTFRVESRAEVAASGTNITDQTPRQLIKYGRNRNVEIAKNTKATPSDRFYQILYAIGARWDFVFYSHPEIVFNLIYQSIKCDTNKERITAFIRRLIQFCSYGSVEWICGALYLLSAVLRIHPFVADLMQCKPQNSIKSYDVNEHEPKLSNASFCPLWELSILANHMHPAVRDFAKQLLKNKHIQYNGDPLKDFKRKVLFEKFTRIMAHKMREFTPNKNRNKNKEQLIDSYLAGDAFIAMYKEHAGYKYKQEKEEEADDDNKEEKEYEMDLDEDDETDALQADSAMFNYLKSHYGSEIPDDQFSDDEEYDYTDLKKEINKQKISGDYEEDVSDVDVYLSDDGEREEIDDENIDEIQDDDDDEDEYDEEAYAEMTENERTKIGNEMLLNDIENENIILPQDVEYASDDEISDALEETDGDQVENDDEKDEVEDEEDEDIGDFFDEKGIAAGELHIN